MNCLFMLEKKKRIIDKKICGNLIFQDLNYAWRKRKLSFFIFLTCLLFPFLMNSKTKTAKLDFKRISLRNQAHSACLKKMQSLGWPSTSVEKTGDWLCKSRRKQEIWKITETKRKQEFSAVVRYRVFFWESDARYLRLILKLTPDTNTKL